MNISEPQPRGLVRGLIKPGHLEWQCELEDTRWTEQILISKQGEVVLLHLES